jgi:glycerophosphoryl diester phosphodiesterase
MACFRLPPIIGHRGARALAPENTLAGLRCAAARGAQWVEIDIRLTRDQVPVVLHDATLERTTTGSGALAAATLPDLAGLDAGGWFGPAFVGEPVPTLARYLAAAAALGMGVNLELKADGSDPAMLAARTVEVARARWPAAAPPLLLTSFEPRCLEALADLAPDWPRGLLMGTVRPDWRSLAERLGVTVLAVDQAALEQEQVVELGASGRAVLAYTVNLPARARTLWDWGVASVFTDCPGREIAGA